MTTSGVFEITLERTEDERSTGPVHELAVQRPRREARARNSRCRLLGLALALCSAGACAGSTGDAAEPCPRDAEPVAAEELFAAENTLIRTAAGCGIPLHVLRPLTDQADLGDRTTCVDESGDLRDLIIVQNTNANSNMRVMRSELLLWLDECSG